MTADGGVRIELWGAPGEVERLGEVLHACVQAGASVGFCLPFARQQADAFWRDDVLPAVRRGSRRLLVARRGEEVAGTVQLDLASPPNGPHRAEVKKLLVHPRARRAGIARLLMAAVEREARAAGRTLLTLDTEAGSDAERLYLALGYTAAGSIPGYALSAVERVPHATTIMYKQLRGAGE